MISHPMGVKIEDVNNLTWLCNIICSLVITLLTLSQGPWSQSVMNFTTDALDIPVVLYFMSVKGFGPAIGGAFGVIGSCLSLIRM